jgi:uncharacterized protein YwgA
MDRQQIGLKLALDTLGLPFSLATFDDRLILQKAASIIQTAGVELGYHFHWYLRGPYSSSLTRDAFAVAAELGEGRDESNGCRLDETSQQRLQRLRGLFDEQDRHSLASKLELLGSVLYLLRHRQIAGSDVAELRRILFAYGKDFSEAEINAGLEELNEYGLCEIGQPREANC